MGSINKKLISKLIDAVGGGWETILYQTLKDVCMELSPTVVDAGVGGIVDEAREILKAYEEHLRENTNDIQAGDSGPDKESSIPAQLQPDDGDKVSPPPGKSIAQGAKPVADEATSSLNQNTPKEEKAEEPTIVFPARNNELEEICRVIAQLPLEGSKPSPKPARASIPVGSLVGQAQGNLPIPGEHRIADLGRISVRTKSGLVLGNGQDDGQVKSSMHVSGYIQSNGKYALVFKDNTLGSAVIIYETIPIIKPGVLELEMISLPDKGMWVSYISGPGYPNMAKATTMEDSKKALLYTLKQKHQMKIISVVPTKRTKGQEEELRLRKAAEGLR